ncbi:MAG TPA: DUF1330 domain-containing protein [Albitalea sp.]
MAAYLIADVEVTDPVGYADYSRDIVATIEAFGGRYLVRGGATEVLEGNWQPRRTIVIEFPSAAQLRAWYFSPAYAPLKLLRERTANARLVMVEGV